MRAAVFFERDGVLNSVRTERKRQIAPLSAEDFRLNLDVVSPLRELKQAGYILLATTNQPGLSRGTLSRRELDFMHEQLQRCFDLDDVLLCPHVESDGCPCRKPKPGLLIEAGFKWHQRQMAGRTSGTRSRLHFPADRIPVEWSWASRFRRPQLSFSRKQNLTVAVLGYFGNKSGLRIGATAVFSTVATRFIDQKRSIITKPCLGFSWFLGFLIPPLGKHLTSVAPTF